MFSAFKVYSSDPVWRQILSELNADVVDAPTNADINLDVMDFHMPIDIVELKRHMVSVNAYDKVIRTVFGRDVHLSRLGAGIVVNLYKSGGMSGADLRRALGYNNDTTTHTIDTAIYQLRKIYGRDFIINDGGIYKIGKL